MLFDLKGLLVVQIVIELNIKLCQADMYSFWFNFNILNPIITYNLTISVTIYNMWLYIVWCFGMGLSNVFSNEIFYILFEIQVAVLSNSLEGNKPEVL